MASLPVRDGSDRPRPTMGPGGPGGPPLETDGCACRLSRRAPAGGTPLVVLLAGLRLAAGGWRPRHAVTPLN